MSPPACRSSRRTANPAELPGETIEASRRALERAEAIVHAELKRGLGGLATIGATAPFVGLFGTVVGILNAFREISNHKATGLGAVAGGISEALVTTAIGLFVAIPAVMMFNYLTGRVEAFDVEMDNSSSELIDYFLKRRNAAAAPPVGRPASLRGSGQGRRDLPRSARQVRRAFHRASTASTAAGGQPEGRRERRARRHGRMESTMSMAIERRKSETSIPTSTSRPWWT